MHWGVFPTQVRKKMDSGKRRLSLRAIHSFRTKGRRGIGGCRCILQLLWELSPSQPPRCCVCPPGERGQCIWTERTDSQNSVALRDLSHQLGHAVCLNHSTLPTECNSPPPGRLWSCHGLDNTKDILCLLWSSCRATPRWSKGNSTQLNKMDSTGPGRTEVKGVKAEKRAGPRNSSKGTQATIHQSPRLRKNYPLSSKKKHYCPGWPRSWTALR